MNLFKARAPAADGRVSPADGAAIIETFIENPICCWSNKQITNENKHGRETERRGREKRVQQTKREFNPACPSKRAQTVFIYSDPKKRKRTEENGGRRNGGKEKKLNAKNCSLLPLAFSECARSRIKYFPGDRVCGQRCMHARAK